MSAETMIELHDRYLRVNSVSFDGQTLKLKYSTWRLNRGRNGWYYASIAVHHEPSRTNKSEGCGKTPDEAIESLRLQVERCEGIEKERCIECGWLSVHRQGCSKTKEASS